MLYGTPTRTHRATVGGAPALFVRGAALDGRLPGQPGELWPLRVVGQHRSPARRTEPQRTAQFLAQGLAALIVLGLTTLTGLFIVGDAQRGNAITMPPDPEAAIASRAIDGKPLTLREFFPDRQQLRTPATYRITQTFADRDCRSATVGALGDVLRVHGCNQVVRAGLTAPYGDYRVTAGVFNLFDAAAAREVDERLRGLVETGDGNFATLPTVDSGVPTLQVGWHAKGHYLLYCVITRPDGKLVTSDDPYAGRITGDLVDAYLSSTLDRRATRRPRHLGSGA